MGNVFCPQVDDPFTKILKQAIKEQSPPNPSKRELDEVWDYLDDDGNDLLDDREIVHLIQSYLLIQEQVLQKYPKPKRKQFRKKHLTPGLDLGDLILKHEKLRSRRSLYTHMEKNHEKVITFFKRLFGLSGEQRLTNAVFRGKGKLVLFQPWNLPRNIRKQKNVKDAGAFDFNPDAFEDEKIRKAFENTHIQYVNENTSHEASLKLIRSTLRKLGKVDNLTLPTQLLTDEEKKELEMLQESSIPEVREKLLNKSAYQNGTIVEVFSSSAGEWILGEVIGAKSDHAVNVRYQNQSKFLNPNDPTKFRLIEKVVGTPFGIGFLQRIRHEDYFCKVMLDWCHVYVAASVVQTIQVQSVHNQMRRSSKHKQLLMGQLLIKVVNAVELPKLDVGGLCDPFVEVTIQCSQSQERTKKTKIIRQNQNPKFDQVLDFKDYMREEENAKGLLKVFDNDRDENANEEIGFVEFSLPARNDIVEDHILDIRVADGTHRGIVIIQTLLIRDELTVAEKTRMRDRFAKHLGEPIHRRKKKRVAK